MCQEKVQRKNMLGNILAGKIRDKELQLWGSAGTGRQAWFRPMCRKA